MGVVVGGFVVDGGEEADGLVGGVDGGLVPGAEVPGGVRGAVGGPGTEGGAVAVPGALGAVPPFAAPGSGEGSGDGDDVLEVSPGPRGALGSRGTRVTAPDGGTAPFGADPEPTAA
ncbi:hypothetical protein [Streptomyces sp. NPDC090025]|uniref:hypothetical protein n=1 Tax=Streptomyces sp. NPDC090025 TaxID=3365922 RepID=UPI003834BF15